MKVNEAIARSLVSEGAGAVFSLLGDTNMELVVLLSELGLPVCEARHEAAAMAMADGYARASGAVAVCAVTAGPGLANLFAPLTSAARTDSPVVVLTGPHSRDDLDGGQHLDHEGLTRLTGARYVPVGSPKVAVDRARLVADLVRSTRRPVVLDVPADVQGMEFPGTPGQRAAPAWAAPQRVHGDPAAVETAAQMLESASRPVILAGHGVLTSGAREELVALGAGSGALLATTLNVRGLFHGEPFDAGVAGIFSSPAATDLFSHADCVVAFGASLNRHTLQDRRLFPQARLVQVDVKPPGPLKGGFSADCYVQGDALAVASRLRDRLPARSGAAGFRTEETAMALKAAVDGRAFEIPPGEVDPRSLCAQLDDLLPAECGFVTGGGHFWSFPIMHMPRWRQPQLYANVAGSIGYGVPVAVGAAVADPRRPLVVFEGDASLMMHLHVLETAARARSRLLVVVMNDRALGAEYHKLRAKGLDPGLSLSPAFDLAGVAASIGCRGATLTDVAQLPGIVEDFVAGEGPLVVDARISREVVSLPYTRVHFESRRSGAEDS